MKISRLFSRVVPQCTEEKKTAPPDPEHYWVQLKSDVIGRVTFTRQIDTYRTIIQAIKARSISELLDLGCNIAALGLLLYDSGYSGTYIGLDSNPYALVEAKKSLKKSLGSALICGNIRILPWIDRAFPCVVMKDVLEHMEDFRLFLSEAARISSKYVVIANFIPWTEGKTIIRREPKGFYHNMYNRYEIYAFAQKLGLEVEEVLSALEEDARPNEVVVFIRSDGEKRE